MTHKNLFWQGFLAVVFAAALWHTLVAFYSHYSYTHLTVQTTPSSVHWEVEEKSPENYHLKTSYIFDFKGNSYAHSTVLTDTSYRNSYAAEQAIKEKSLQPLKIWFDAQDPHHSSLQKKLPLKEYISVIFLWGLLLYFLWLGFYVAKFKN